MIVTSAFVGRSFEKEDEPLWIEISKFLDSLRKVGFSWEDAEEAQAKPISDKVKEKIDRNDFFIGILTKRDPICNRYLPLGDRYSLLASVTNWLTSYWVIQESGYAIGKGKKVLFIIESGLGVPGGLNADFEYVLLDRRNLSDAFRKLNEIVSEEIGKKIPLVEEQPSGKSIEINIPPKSEIKEREEEIEEKTTTFAVVLEAIEKKDFPIAQEKFDLLLQEEKFRSDPELQILAKLIFYRKLYFSGQSETLDQLRKIANENPNNYFAVEALVDCFEFYDQHEESIKTIESYINPEHNDARIRLLILLSSIDLKEKAFERAKDRLSPLLHDVALNSRKQNFHIYKALGDIYKEKGELDTSCFLYERALDYEPIHLDVRFTLAYNYAELKRVSLSAYHYKTYLKTEENTAAMNNLGLEYEELKLLGKSVQLLKKADKLDYTLAASNLARMYIEKGFYEEAKSILTKAAEKKDHHQNVDYYLSELKNSEEKEEKEAELIFEDTRKNREFLIDFAQAVSIPFDKYTELNGIWVTEYGELEKYAIKFVQPNILIGEHELKAPTASSLLPALAGSESEPALQTKRITFSGTITNRGIRYSVKISIPGRTFLTQTVSKFSGLGVLHLESQEIEFSVEKDGKTEFFSSRKKKVANVIPSFNQKSSIS